MSVWNSCRFQQNDVLVFLNKDTRNLDTHVFLFAFALIIPQTKSSSVVLTRRALLPRIGIYYTDIDN
jgi:hypothetical protein